VALFRPMHTRFWISRDQARSRMIGTFGEIQQLMIDVGHGDPWPLVPPASRRRISHLGARGTRFCLAPNEGPEVHCIDQDGEHMIARWSQEDVATPDSVIELRWRQMRESAGPLSPEDVERMIAAAIIPPTMPPVSALAVDTGGGFLVVGPDIQRSVSGRLRARVFASSGELLGLGDIPPIVVHELGADYLLGVSRNADGVEFVELYRVRRTESGA
jgi:hypothetical protein